MTGYWMERQGGTGRMFCGTTAQEVANCVKAEIESEQDLPADERDTITLTAFEVTQEEIDAMPEFDGW